jgi:porin
MLDWSREIGRRAGAAAVVVAALFTTTAHAQDAANSNGIPEQSIATSLPQNGDPGGHRKALADRGITYGLNYIGEWQGNTSGGTSRGSIYIGRFEALVDVDLEKFSAWKGLSFHANAFQIHGRGLSREHLSNLMTASFIEALPATRLSELWLEQKIFGDKANVRFGQLAADTEFTTSSYGAQFINSTFGFPTITAANLPSGGPAYPLATPGVRLKVDPNKNVSFLLGLYNGDPAGPGLDDPQERNRHGLNFRIKDPALLMGELQYRYNQDKGVPGLAGSLKAGAWGHFGKFDDQRVDSTGLSLADPASSGVAARRRGNHGVYGVIDQQIWRPSSGEPDKGIGVFARASASPSDRNLVDLYLDGGIAFAGMIPHRPDDVVAFGAAYTRISDDARRFDADAVRFNGAGVVRTYEALVEFNYQAQIIPGMQVDFDVQRIFNPGGNIANPNDPAGAAIKDATVLTLHTSIKY